MQGLSLLAQIVYLRALRRHMDYSTGVVGVRRRISRRSIAETVYADPVQGRHADRSGAPTPDAIRAALRELIRAGLIEVVPAHRQLVFFLPLAEAGESVQNMSTRSAPDPEWGMSAQEKHKEIVNIEHVGTRSAPDGAGCMSATHPVTGIKHSVVQHSGNSPRARVDRAALHDALREEFPNHAAQVAGRAVAGMVDDWVSRGVSVQQVRRLVGAVRQRDDRAFGPAYLAGPMRDMLAGLRIVPTERDGDRPPVDDDALWSWATERGHPDPAPGETHAQYRERLVALERRRRAASDWPTQAGEV